MSKYEFDNEFMQKVAALAIRDATFCIRTEGLIDPSYFENEAQGSLVALVQRYYAKYKTVPSTLVLTRLLKAAVDKKIIRSDIVDDVKDELKMLLGADLSDRDYVIDEVAEFAKHQAIIGALEKSAEALDKREFETIEKNLQAAFLVGAGDDNEGMDLDADIDARTAYRKDVAAGVIIPGITTGFKDLDDALPGSGFQRGELAVLMGPAKRGKSFGLMNFAVNARLAGYNVLKITLENSARVTLDRADAYLTQIETNDLVTHLLKADGDLRARLGKIKKGMMKVHEFPTGTFAPKDLRRLVERYRAKGITFDIIVVDYWDIMAPDKAYKDDKISESASIGIGLRGIAKEENVAVVTAIQSNRDGFKAHTAGAEHAAEDFNKVRLADVFFSINSDDEERQRGEARIYMAAVRNKASGYTINIKQNLAKATFISSVMGRMGI